MYERKTEQLHFQDVLNSNHSPLSLTFQQPYYHNGVSILIWRRGEAEAQRSCRIINLRAKHSEPLHVKHPAKVIAASEPAELGVDK